MAGPGRVQGPSLGHTEDMTRVCTQKSGPLRGQHSLVGARGTRATHSVAYGFRAKRACRAPKLTHYTDAETEAWSGPVAKGPEKQVDFPWTPIKSKACQNSSAMPYTVPATKMGSGEGAVRAGQALRGGSSQGAWEEDGKNEPRLFLW